MWPQSSRIVQHLRVKLCAWLWVQDGKVKPMGLSVKLIVSRLLSNDAGLHCLTCDHHRI